MNYYYADENDEPVGPFTLEEIKDQASEGKISANPKVRAEGAVEWTELSSVETTEPEPAPAEEPSEPAANVTDDATEADQKTSFGEKVKSINSTLLSDFVTSLLKVSGRLLNPDFLGKTLNKARNFGHYVVLAGAVLALVYSIFAAIKGNKITDLFLGIGLVAALTIAQFAAQSFLGAGEKLIQNTTSRIASTAFLDCFGLLSLLGAAVALLGGIIGAIQTSSFAPVLPGVLVSVFLTYVAAVMLHPKLVNVEIGDSTAGEEAIGLLTLALKAGLKLVPLFFFLLAAFGALLILAGFVNAGGQWTALVSFIPFTQNQQVGFTGIITIIFACLTPMLAYLYFLVLYVVFDLIRAILSIPGKLDALKK